MPPSIRRALLGIPQSAIVAVTLAHTPQPPGDHLAPHVSRDAGTRAPRLSGASERLTCTLQEMSADADPQPV
jgi:hypothetical protein